ncbi:MAG TPA: pseudouridine synthase [Anaerolineales bacterium]|nr:pseudouridine synthase [Anaerolineales bacterium]
MSSERIQKILAHAGFGSRRSCEKLIEDNRVRVNNQPVKLGDKADLDLDEITVDGRKVNKTQSFIYIALNKPRNVISAVKSPDPRRTVRDLVDVEGSFYPVGRLDADSEGLILLTNDGDLANILTHPRYEHEKEYRVLVARHPDEEQLNLWRRGVVLEDGYKTKPALVQFQAASGKGAWLRVILHEGRKRQIREMGKVTGLPIVSIIRMRIATLKLENLKPGQWRYLTPDEIRSLKELDKQPITEQKRKNNLKRK